jgi:hypothetical protein
MLSTLRNKTRALVEDFSKSKFETFTYRTSNIFTIAQTNIVITKVLKNGEELESAQYSFDEITNKITITTESGDELISGDIIEVDYTYYKYSDTELNEYIRAALVWLNVYSYNDDNYDFSTVSAGQDISPTPDDRTSDLIALICSILIRPDYTQYKLPNLTVIYNAKMPKEDRIEKLIGKFSMGLGVVEIIQFDIVTL